MTPAETGPLPEPVPSCGLDVLLLADGPTGVPGRLGAHRATSCASLADVAARLRAGRIDALVLDVRPAAVLAAVEAVLSAAPRAVLVVCGPEELTEPVLARGGQDVVPPHGDLERAVTRAVARARSRHAPAGARLAEAVLDALESPTCTLGADGRIVAVNAAWTGIALAGGAEPAACGVGADYLAACEVGPAGTADAITAQEVSTGVRDVLAGRSQRFHAEYRCHSPVEQRWFSVRITPVRLAHERGAVVEHVDVTAMRHVQETLSQQALHDPLTGLPNRSLLVDRLQQALSDSGRRGTATAVAFVDLDRFTRVDDLGHAAGDELLTQVAGRLAGQVRSGDTVARFSGDEFVVVWRDLRGDDEVALLSQRLTEALAAPLRVDGRPVEVSASIGVAVGRWPQSAQKLLLAADAAMYDAKGRGRGRVRVFTAALRRDAEARRATEHGLSAALERGELVVHYQPVVDLATGRAVAAEALVRWEHPERGLLGPDLFVPVAETSGQIVALGRWVLERACRDAASWTGAAADLDVAVDLSVRQLTQPEVLRQVRDALSASGLAPQRLLLELGVRIAVDDFGTGYSSLLYLRRYPISALKVDRAFVSGIGTGPDDEAICGSVVGLAHAVGATSIAEGVETAEQHAVLRALGCQQAQGFLWSPAVPTADLERAVRDLARVAPAAAPADRSLPEGRLDPAVGRRMGELHAAGASLHTVAAALNREGAAHPAGLRWHAHAVGRHLAVLARGR